MRNQRPLPVARPVGGVAIVRPTAQLFDSWAAAVAEFGSAHINGAGLHSPVTPNRATLDDLIKRAALLADVTAELPGDTVHNDLFWLTLDGEVVAFLSVRHGLNDWLREAGGHIGYSVRRSRRRQGFATLALRYGLERACELGLDQVMVMCDDDNVGSYRTIEQAGGVLQDVSDQSIHGHPALRRYRIDLSVGSASLG